MTRRTRLASARRLHDAAWPDMFANLHSAYADLTRAQFELQRRAAEIEAGRDLFQLVIESMSEVLLLLDRAGCVLQANPAAQALLECGESQMVGRPFAELCGSDQMPATPWQLLERASAGVLQDTEFTLRTRSGRALPVSASCGLVRDKQGKIVGMLVVARDVTEQKRVEQERERLLAAEQAARAEAEAALQARDEFLSAAAHDLKTPLTGIKGGAQLLRRMIARPAGPDPERLAEGLGGLETAAMKMARQVDQLLDASRLQAGQPLDLDRRPTDLVALARRAAAEHQTTSDRHRIPVSAPEAEVVGLWDASRIERVLDNLLGNAVKYSPEGGEITLTITRQEDPAGSWAVLAVRDQGLGIPPSDLPRVFERFHRAANVAGWIPGTGIGLAGARQIVEQHGGTIAVESEEGAGSTFTVRLPLAPCDPAAPPDGGAHPPAVPTG